MTRVVAFGEVLLRLKAPGFERFLQTPLLEVFVGGAELNVLASLARFEHPVSLVTTLPQGPLGDAALAEIRALGIDASGVYRQAGRMGLYFAESGHGFRPGQILYDRAGSAFVTDQAAHPWAVLLAGAKLLHLTGITPALSAHAAAATIAAAQQARQLGLQVSLDVNFRAQLWAAAGRACEVVLAPLLQQVQILFASSTDLVSGLGLSMEAPEGTPIERFERTSASALDALPALQVVCTCLRQGERADSNRLIALGRDRSGLHVSPERLVETIVDRIGGGDAFAAGVLHSLLADRPLGAALEFGLAAAVLKHSIAGDVNRVSAAEVSAHLAGMSAALLRR
jgi:2-dehydro-3-deoxygluconokinase